MEDRPNPAQGNPDTRAPSLGQLPTQRFEKPLDVPPGDIRPDRIFEDELKRPAVAAVERHGVMI